MMTTWKQYFWKGTDDYGPGDWYRPSPEGQDGDCDLALLMRHVHHENHLGIGIMEGYEFKFIECISSSISRHGEYKPTACELIVIQGLNNKLAHCLPGAVIGSADSPEDEAFFARVRLKRTY